MKTKTNSKLLLIFAIVLTLVATTSCKKNGWETEISIGVGVSLSGVNGNFSINFGNGNIQNSSSNIVWGIVRKGSVSAPDGNGFITTSVEFCGTTAPYAINNGNGWSLQNPLSSSSSFNAYAEGNVASYMYNSFYPSWNGYTVMAVQMDLNQIETDDSGNSYVKITGAYTPNEL